MLAAPHAYSQCQSGPRTDWWIVDGPVRAVAIRDQVAYLGGEFTYVGPRTGPLVMFDPFFAESVLTAPRIRGVVYAVAPDGKGGWFVGGEFTHVGLYPRTNLVHLTRDLAVDVEWDAQVAGTAVYALEVRGDRLYVGGQFTRIGGAAQRGLAALRVDDATLVPWNPALNGHVYAMVPAEDVVYVAGSINAAGSDQRNNLAAVDITTGAATAWNPNADRAVLALAVDGDSVYVGGQFTTVGGKPRNRLAELDRSTGAATTWNPNPNSLVRALAVTSTQVLVGGDFTTISVQNRHGFAAVNRGNGAAQPLDFAIAGGSEAQVRAVKVVGDVVYIGGFFARVQGRAQPMLAAAELATGIPVAIPLGTLYNGGNDNAVVHCLGAFQDEVLCGGAFESIGGQSRVRAAALSTTTGAVQPWNPAPSGTVQTLLPLEDAVFLGGVFTNAGGAKAPGLAKVDRLSGAAVTNWSLVISNRSAVPEVRQLAAADDRLYLGGLFDSVAGKTARFVAAVDPDSGASSDFDAALKGGSSGLQAMAQSGDVLFVAGDFTAAGGQTVARLAALDLVTGAGFAWAPAPNREVTALAATPDRLYVGGSFTRIGGVDIRHLVSFDARTRELLPWDPALGSSSSGIQALAATDTVVYVAGSFESIGGEFRAGVAALSPVTAQALDWNPAPNAVPTVLLASGERVCLAGGFRTVASGGSRYPAGYLAAYERSPRFTGLSLDAQVLNLQTTTGDRTIAILEMSRDLKVWSPVQTNDNPGFPWKLTRPVGETGLEFYRLRAE